MPESKLSYWFVPTFLRDLRESRGKTQSEAAEYMMVSRQSIINWETGKKKITFNSASALLTYYRSDAEDIAYVNRVMRQGISGCVVQYTEGGFDIRIIEVAERHYGEIWKCEPHIVPGVAQIREHHFHPPMIPRSAKPEQVEEAWRVKSLRQKETFNNKHLNMNLLISASCLRQMEHVDWGTKQLEQLIHLDSIEGVSVRVNDEMSHWSSIPFDVYLPGASPSAGPGFVYMESPETSLYVEAEEKVRTYHEAVKELFNRSKGIGELAC